MYIIGKAKTSRPQNKVKENKRNSRTLLIMGGLKGVLKNYLLSYLGIRLDNKMKCHKI